MSDGAAATATPPAAPGESAGEGSRLSILHLVSSGRWTGAAEPATMLAREQHLQGHAVAVACLGGSSFERRLAELGLTYVDGFTFNRNLNPADLKHDIATLRATLQRMQPDVVHCHLPHDHWIAALALRRPLGPRRHRRVAIVRTLHRETAPRSDLAHRWLVGKGSDMVIAVSQSQRRAMIEQVGLPAPRVVWVRGAVDLEKFQPGLDGEAIRRQYEIPREARVAGMVARMQPHRGHLFFLNCVDDVVGRVPEALLAVAGRGELKVRIIEHVERHPLAAHLRRLLYHKNDLELVYAAMDVAVLVVPGSDGSCRAMLEAMACGRPVIAARVGAMADAIEPGVNGWLYEPGDRASLAAALAEALGDMERLREMGRAARRYVEQHHSRAAQYQQTLAVYQEALARRAKAI